MKLVLIASSMKYNIEKILINLQTNLNIIFYTIGKYKSAFDVLKTVKQLHYYINILT